MQNGHREGFLSAERKPGRKKWEVHPGVGSGKREGREYPDTLTGVNRIERKADIAFN